MKQILNLITSAMIVNLMAFHNALADRPFDSFGEPNTVIMGMIQDQSRLNISNGVNEVNIPESPFDNLLQYEQVNTKSVYQYSIIGIRVYSNQNEKLEKLEDTKLTGVTITIGNATPIPVALNSTDKQSHTFNLDVESIWDQLDVKPANGDVVTVSPVFSDSDGYNVPNFNGVFKDKRSLYQSLNSNTGGVWVPTLLFSSTLNSDETGIPFAAQPVGLAWGVKRNYNKFYVGYSLMANWLIYSEGEEVDLTTTTSFSVANIGLGFIIDINDAIYLGYSYGNDLREGKRDPGSMLVLGFGSRAIRFLKSNDN